MASGAKPEELPSGLCPWPNFYVTSYKTNFTCCSPVTLWSSMSRWWHRTYLHESVVLPRQVVHPSVCLSVTLRYRNHIGWNSAKIISRLISLTISLCQTPTWRIYSKENTPNFSRNRSAVGKIVDFRHLSRHILKRCKIGSKLLLTTNRNMCTFFRLVPKSMTLDDLWAKFKVIDSFHQVKCRKNGDIQLSNDSDAM